MRGPSSDRPLSQERKAESERPLTLTYRGGSQTVTASCAYGQCEGPDAQHAVRPARWRNNPGTRAVRPLDGDRTPLAALGQRGVKSSAASCDSSTNALAADRRAERLRRGAPAPAFQRPWLDLRPGEAQHPRSYLPEWRLGCSGSLQERQARAAHRSRQTWRAGAMRGEVLRQASPRPCGPGSGRTLRRWRQRVTGLLEPFQIPYSLDRAKKERGKVLPQKTPPRRVGV